MRDSHPPHECISSAQIPEEIGNRVPDALGSRSQWLVARRSPNDDYRDKQPILPKREFTDPSRLLPLQRAVREGTRFNLSRGGSCRIRGDESAVLGFVLTEDDPLVFIDWDNVRLPSSDDRNVPALVRDEIAQLGGYVEISTSGTGLHQFVLGSRNTQDLLDERKSQGRLPLDSLEGLTQPHVEVYRANRYAVTTGNVWTPPQNV